jgi:hypothetical protein
MSLPQANQLIQQSALLLNNDPLKEVSSEIDLQHKMRIE